MVEFADFGSYLKIQCEENGISMYQLSKLSGIPTSTISNYVYGTSPTLDKADRLLRALGVSLTIGKPETEVE